MEKAEHVGQATAMTYLAGRKHMQVDSSSLDRQWDIPLSWLGVMSGPERYHVIPEEHSVSFTLDGLFNLRWRSGQRERNEAYGPGCITILPAGESHLLEVDGANRSLTWAVSVEALRDLVRPDLGADADNLTLQLTLAGSDPALWYYGDALARELQQPSLASRSYVESLHQGLMVHLVRHYSSVAITPRLAVNGTGSIRLNPVVQHIHDHLGENLSLNDLAPLVNLSPFQFIRTFKRAFQQTPHQYILRLRVDRAKQLLQSRHLALSEVATLVGFSSQSHFTNTFRRLVGVTPMAYRAIWQRKPDRIA
ncbi:MAG: AraC family transcriptional regulator [Gemmataceae bacterium]